MRNLLSAALVACALAGCAHSQQASSTVSDDNYQERERVCGRWMTVEHRKEVVARYAKRVLLDGNGREISWTPDATADAYQGAAVIRCYNGYASP